jgi:hypothetical protein
MVIARCCILEGIEDSGTGWGVVEARRRLATNWTVNSTRKESGIESTLISLSESTAPVLYCVRVVFPTEMTSSARGVMIEFAGEGSIGTIAQAESSGDLSQSGRRIFSDGCTRLQPQC